MMFWCEVMSSSQISNGTWLSCGLITQAALKDKLVFGSNSKYRESKDGFIIIGEYS